MGEELLLEGVKGKTRGFVLEGGEEGGGRRG